MRPFVEPSEPMQSIGRDDQHLEDCCGWLRLICLRQSLWPIIFYNSYFIFVILVAKFLSYWGAISYNFQYAFNYYSPK